MRRFIAHGGRWNSNAATLVGLLVGLGARARRVSFSLEAASEAPAAVKQET